MTPAHYTALRVHQAVFAKANGLIERRLHDAGLVHYEYLILLAVLELSPTGRPTVSQVIQAVGMPVSGISATLKTLDDRGFIQRERAAIDRRRILLTLTPHGLAWIRPIAADMLAVIRASGMPLMRATRDVLALPAMETAADQPEMDAWLTRARPIG